MSSSFVYKTGWACSCMAFGICFCLKAGMGGKGVKRSVFVPARVAACFDSSDFVNDVDTCLNGRDYFLHVVN